MQIGYKEGNESVTNCYQLKLPAADGKKRLTVKQWLAQLGEQRIDQMIDPELTFQRAVEDYRRQGYSDIFLQKKRPNICVCQLLSVPLQRLSCI